MSRPSFHVPSPYQQAIATERRAKLAWIIAKVAVGLMVIGVAAGLIGN